MDTHINQQGYCILIAGDKADDHLSYSHALKAAGVHIPVFTFHEGDHLISFLKENRKKEHAHMPLLIISSLNGPGQSSTMLQRIKGHPDFSEIPLIVLSGDRTVHDIRNYYHLGASSFLPKPRTAEEMEVIANGIKIFWLDGFV